MLQVERIEEEQYNRFLEMKEFLQNSERSSRLGGLHTGDCLLSHWLLTVMLLSHWLLTVMLLSHWMVLSRWLWTVMLLSHRC